MNNTNIENDNDLFEGIEEALNYKQPYLEGHFAEYLKTKLEPKSLKYKTKMTHYISANIERGQRANQMIKGELTEILDTVIHNAPENKEDCWLIAAGYNSENNLYRRAESSFDKLSTVLLDFDNEEFDPDLITKFKKLYDDYEYYLWETASSTPWRPKFRAIIPLDKEIPFKSLPISITKRAIYQVFSVLRPDPKASWFFTPTKGKLDTFTHHEGTKFPSFEISGAAFMIETAFMMEERKREAYAKQYAEKYKNDPKGWLNMKSVQKCINGLVEGERDSWLSYTCYKMRENNYPPEAISEFLNLVPVPEDMKRKFRLKYCHHA